MTVVGDLFAAVGSVGAREQGAVTPDPAFGASLVVNGGQIAAHASVQ